MSCESKEKPILFELGGLCFVLFAIDMLQQNLTAKSQTARVERRRRHCQSLRGRRRRMLLVFPNQHFHIR